MKNQFISLVGLILCCTFLTGCGEKTQTVEWYMQHQDVLDKEYEKCKLKPLLELMQDKHCNIVKNAKEKVFNDQQRNAPIPKFDFSKTLNSNY